MGKIPLPDMSDPRNPLKAKEVEFKPQVLAGISATTSSDVATQLQFIVETPTKGSWPASGTFTYIAPMAQCMLQTSRGIIPIRNVGTFDIHALTASVRGGAWALGNMCPYNVTFIKRAINRGAGAANDTLGVLMKEAVGGATDTYISANFAGPTAVNITGTPGSPLLVDAGLISRFPTIGTADPCSSLTKVSAGTDAPIMFSDGGDTPITIAGGTPTVGMIQVSITQNPRPVYGVGPTEYVALPLTARGVGGRIAILHTGTTYWANYENATGGTIIWTLKTGTGTLTLADYRFDQGRLAYGADGSEIYEIYNFVAKTATVTP